LTPNDIFKSHTAPLTSKRFILYIYSTNIGTEYFKHSINSPFFHLQNAVCFIILTYLVPVLFTFYIQNVLKLKKNNSGAKRLTAQVTPRKKAYFIKMIVTQPVKKFTVLCGTHSEVSLFIRTIQWTLTLRGAFNNLCT